MRWLGERYGLFPILLCVSICVGGVCYGQDISGEVKAKVNREKARQRLEQGNYRLDQRFSVREGDNCSININTINSDRIIGDIENIVVIEGAVVNQAECR